MLTDYQQVTMPEPPKHPVGRIPPAPLVYRFFGTGLAASMWFFVCDQYWDLFTFEKAILTPLTVNVPGKERWTRPSRLEAPVGTLRPGIISRALQFIDQRRSAILDFRVGGVIGQSHKWYRLGIAKLQSKNLQSNYVHLTFFGYRDLSSFWNR